MEAPIDSDCWDFFLQVFLFLYPLFDLCIAIGDGRDSNWVEMMNKYQTIFFEEETEGGGVIKPEFDHEQEDTEKDYQIGFPNLKYESDFDLESLEDERKRKNIEIVQREGRQKFRSNLLKVYGGKCVVTGCDVVAALDAAHIVNYSGVDSNHIQNGLLLRRDIHRLFDEKLITIDPESMTIVIAPELIGSHYETLKDIRIRLPEDKAYSPSLESLRKHRDDFIQKHQ